MTGDKEKLRNKILSSQISRETAKEIVQAFYKLGQNSEGTDAYAEAYNYERLIMNCVMNGNSKELETYINSSAPAIPTQIGHMSDNPNHQALYMLVSCVTLCSRFAIAGGVTERDAYHLSDVYLQQADRADSPDKIIQLIPAAFRQFTQLVSNVKRKKIKSYPVAQSIRYINEHLYSRFALKELAEYCHVTPQYLSMAFHKEIGITITHYVRQEKLKIAEQMLVLSNYSIQTISDILNFSTASVFCTQFKRQYGSTPEDWRIQNIHQISFGER